MSFEIFSLSCELFAFSHELFSFPCEFFAYACELLLRLRSYRRSCLFVRGYEGEPMLFCDGALDVRCRCAQVGFELSAQADADTVERRTNVVVERR